MIQNFKTYLQNHDLIGLSSIPKSDLHNHTGCGGNVNYIASRANLKINPPPAVFESLSHMYNWFKSIDICVDEFGTADDVMEAVEELELDEVHHGIAAAKSAFIMK